MACLCHCDAFQFCANWLWLLWPQVMSTSVECEGFICPYCLVGFSQQQQLQQHFLEMHSGLGIVEQDDYDVVEYIEDEVRTMFVLLFFVCWFVSY